ncbi:MAG TPA: DUF1349 domain-containing protein [Hypericibacter adhaerens]|jgi:regulation of enolase protein 1 (concanavalin A-like superfamily)|uniref:Regulation of enolase 1 n=1 Tax=Hypericibacter adhaerens TaxID=2602016 RepID=A0A5J6N239_9PROT|nr:DUF1349 domain-containing protein [Hypericibacter adhaerens]QEX22650.1 regulation of enolase 1 [Hypericibacter adhaerens]HWA45408.1 DUF1349 domain-containing protein [Hypericibacter adhaerens]
MFETCRWINEPAHWRLEGGRLRVTTDDHTDFWRETHYGFTRDNGHFFGCPTGPGFTADLRVRAQYRELYDQAGIMVRLDATHWVKAGIELTDGRPHLGSVLTLGQSDWATGPFEGDASDFWIRASVSEGVLKLQASADGKQWPTLRLCPFPVTPSYQVGPFCCTPERQGLDVEFSAFRVGPPLNKDLHDLS